MAFPLVPMLLFFYLFGAALKFIDDAYDENRWPKPAAWLAAVVALAFVLGFSFVDGWAATLLLALILAVTVTLKVRHPPFAATVTVYYVVFMLFELHAQVHWPLLAVALTAMAADEAAARAGKRYGGLHPHHPLGGEMGGPSGTLLYFLRYRYIALLVLLAAAALGMLPLVYWLTWAALEFGYAVMESVAARMGSREALLHILV